MIEIAFIEIKKGQKNKTHNLNDEKLTSEADKDKYCLVPYSPYSLILRPGVPREGSFRNNTRVHSAVEIAPRGGPEKKGHDLHSHPS